MHRLLLQQLCCINEIRGIAHYNNTSERYVITDVHYGNCGTIFDRVISPSIIPAYYHASGITE